MISLPMQIWKSASRDCPMSPKNNYGVAIAKKGFDYKRSKPFLYPKSTHQKSGMLTHAAPNKQYAVL